ncbi:MAG: hypothetical protein GF331_25620 [Chitinivibrionales bacterium]|nr:hypothetical protein [Chitinivibrionales bacterium]
MERDLRRLDKITKELQDLTTSLRMVPVRSVFQRMARIVRDLSRQFGKQLDFVVEGEDTEVDKSIVDMIADPLVHIMRNMAAHGIEPQAERRRSGKPPAGRIELRAYHSGGTICIEASDDGRGLDRDAILAKARERGMLAADEALTDEVIYSLIFQPGFSTAHRIDDVSGRGVGLDVVKKNVARLRGTVEVSSAPGQGTTFRLRLPLTLAMIDGLIVRVGSEQYIVPTLAVRRAVQPGPGAIRTVMEKGEMMLHQGELIPLYRLRALLEMDAEGRADELCVALLTEEGGSKAAILVDELVGKQQFVIKGLDGSIRKSVGFSGSAIMSDGTVCLILNVSQMSALREMAGAV